MTTLNPKTLLLLFSKKLFSDVPGSVVVVVFLNSLLSNKKLKNWTNVSRDSFTCSVLRDVSRTSLHIYNL